MMNGEIDTDKLIDKCLNCGICCHYIITRGGKKSLKKCRHLRGDVGATHCAIYKDRLYKIIDRNVLCLPRLKSQIDYPGCPYNTGKGYYKFHCGLYNNMNNKNGFKDTKTAD